MLKDLHELHAKYYKRLLYYKGMPCILDERGSNQMLSGFFSVRRICKEMPADASIWPIKKWLFFHYFCRFLGRSQRWPLLSIWKCFDFDALLKGFLLSRGRGDYSTKVFWYHRAPHHQVWSTGKERQTKSAQNCSPTWMNRKEEEQYQPYINSKRKYALSKIWILFQSISLWIAVSNTVLFTEVFQQLTWNTCLPTVNDAPPD